MTQTKSRGRQPAARKERTMQTQSSTPTLKLALRPDVKSAVDELIQIFKDFVTPEKNEWDYYYNAKHAISRVCGWDSPRHKYDQDQFELAMFTYTEGVGL